MYKPDSLLVRGYHASPLFLQNFLFSLAGLRNHRQRYNRHFYEHLQFLKQSEWWSKDQIEMFQKEHLQLMIKQAYAGSEFIRAQFLEARLYPEDIKSTADLKLLPLCNKDQLREFKGVYWNKAINKKDLILGHTSGTSGRALVTYHTRSTLAFQWAVWARHKERFGVRVGDKHLTFGARVPVDANQSKPPFWRWNYFGKQMYLSTFHLSDKYLPEIVKFLNNESFDYYTGYPSSMYVVAKFMEEKGIRLTMRPKYVITGSDALLPQFEKTIREQFGVSVTEQYGMAEACGNFAKCEFGKFHLDFEFGIVELLDVPDQPNRNFKRLVFTSLANTTMPLIRYDIGDFGEVDETRCACGRNSLTLKSIQGRLEDYILTPDGRKVTGMNQVFEWANGIKEIQITQKEVNSIEVTYIPDYMFSEKDLQNLETEFRKRLGTEIGIHYKMVEHIPRSSSGKYKAVISLLNSQSLHYS